MKTKNLFRLSALIAVLNLIPAGRVTAQTLTTLYDFTAGTTNSDGAYPNGLILSGNTLYGTANRGGNSAVGTVFAVNTDGTGFTNLHSFTDMQNSINSDGAYPSGILTLSVTSLYGTTQFGGSTTLGTVFSLSTDGTRFTNLHNFNSGDGRITQVGLTLSGSTLYGTAPLGGSSGNGTVFSLSTDGTDFTNLHNFTALPPFYSTNNDGATPYARLILSGNTLYGTARYGGSSGNGTVFSLSTDGTGFMNLHSFTATHTNYFAPGAPLTNSDGAHPMLAELSLSGSTLYGTAPLGGGSGVGTVFKVNTDGTGFAVLHTFRGFDGSKPHGLILSGTTLYGTTPGDSFGYGKVFSLSTDGTGFRNLHSFTYQDGAYPSPELILSGNTLYGTAGGGGSSGNGTVFSISFRPQLTISPSGANVILSWPTNVAGFDYTGYTLQSAPALAATFTNLPAAKNPYTNPITGPQQFFRLSQ